ncbi:MAG: SIS domain-containing protein [Pirellulales bacterium]
MMFESIESALRQQTDQLRSALDALDDWYTTVAGVIERLREAFENGNTVFVAGNGGSATLAQHFSDEMIGRFLAARRPYPVVSLTADSAVLTCIANDFGYEEVFRRQVEALGKAGDVLIAFSTSGRSENILAACRQACDQRMTVIGFSGPAGDLKDAADIAVIAPTADTARIQELDLHAVHLVCAAFEPS